MRSRLLPTLALLLTTLGHAAVVHTSDFTKPSPWTDEAGSQPDLSPQGALWPGTAAGLSLRSPALNLPTEAFQTVELTVTFEQPGAAHLLWQGQGFSRSQSGWQGALPIEAPADGQPHQLRLLPFWQDVKLIESLRIIAQPGTRLRLQNLRIITPDLNAGDHVNWDLTSPLQAGQWLPQAGAATLQPGPDGLRVTLREPSALIMSPALQALAFAYEWLSARVTATRPARLKLQWATSALRGLHGETVTLRPGTHTYNVRCGLDRAWAGQLRGLAFELTGPPQTDMTVQALGLSHEPQGAADLRTLYAGPLEPQVQPGRAFRLIWALQNEGGQQVRDVKVTISATTGLSLPTGPLAIDRMDHAVPEVLTWLAKADQPGSITLSAEYAGQVLTEEIKIALTEPTAEPSAPPVALPPGPVVAAHYHAPPPPLFGPEALDRLLYRRPYLGDYALDPAVMAWQERWSLDHGLGAWIIDVGDSADARVLDAFLASPYFRQMKFAFRWTAAAPLEADGLALFGQRLAPILRQPNYLQWQNKPLVLVDNALRRTGEGWGLADLTGLLKQVNLSLVACVPLNVPETGVLQQAGYAAAADLHADRSFPRLPTPAEDWARAAAAKIPHLPSLEPIWSADLTPQRLRTLLSIALLRARNAPEATVPVIIAGDFNADLGLEPRRPGGFLWLDAVRQATALPPVTPALPEADFNRPQAAAPSAWEFDTKQDWTDAMGLSFLRAVGGMLTGHTDSNEPAIFGGNTKLDTRQFRAIAIGLSASAGKTGRLYWRTSLRKLTRDHSVPFDLIADGALHEYRLDLTKAPGWQGYLEALRLDPTDTAGANIAIDYLRVLPN